MTNEEDFKEELRALIKHISNEDIKNDEELIYFYVEVFCDAFKDYYVIQRLLENRIYEN